MIRWCIKNSHVSLKNLIYCEKNIQYDRLLSSQ
jgi:hypothetical protein